MAWTRRDFLQVMLASALAESVDFERLLWTPKPMVVVPSMPDKIRYDILLTDISIQWSDCGYLAGQLAQLDRYAIHVPRGVEVRTETSGSFSGGRRR